MPLISRASGAIRTLALRWFWRPGRGWDSLAAALALAMLLPVLGIVAAWAQGDAASRDILAHLMATVLPGYVRNSMVIGLSVALGVTLVGVSTAWVVAAHEFPGCRFFAWALILPLAMPAYVMAYAYTDFLQFSGPLQGALRKWLGVPRLAWFPEIRSWYGASLVFVSAFYPYVYLLARTAFVERNPRLDEAARTLGCGPWRRFGLVALPLARPAVVAGVALVLMETLADYGAVAYFGVPTFTTGIYRAWLSMGDRLAAAQLASLLLLFVLVLLALETRSRASLRFHSAGPRTRRIAPAPLHGVAGWAATALCGVPLLLGFGLPALIMLRLAWLEAEAVAWARYAGWVWNTLVLAGLTAGLAVLLATVLAYAQRHSPGRLPRWAARMVGAGYAIPGAVIAVGLLTPMTRLDAWLAGLMGAQGLVLSGSMGMLIYAYLVRFMAAGVQTIEAGLAKISPSLESSARSLGVSGWAMLRAVHAPLLRRSVLSAALLVFVDVMKELPATLALRPFNMDTLAVVASQFAADERLGEAALPALTLVAVGLIPVFLISRTTCARP
ncbi:iron ABC transporter permease [Pandoraea sp.]|uniref:ABC transporter permease n=1 Tax=Pandoraea sp. TaxID=1883445 RepID=UPI00120BDE1A|nr:iron ABC transporter permease [Pandoraea sp.]TAL57042.1 MAG: iron ABC transporter permease [Pandoraea sp.]TAM18085.1 MAG: iron ABC transporter permease [Pandoraea sp.]